MSSIQGIELTVTNGKATTTSRQIAHQFNKQHKDLVRKIINLDCSKEFNARNFAAR